MLKRNDAGGRRDHARRSPQLLLLSLLALLAAGVLGCPLGFDVAENGGIGGSGISQGPISGFGSIFVNGIEWETGEAEIILDDAPSIEGALRLGMVVRVEGTLGPDGLRGQAERVEFDDAVEGPVDDMPVETVPGVEKRFSVLGRMVTVDVDFTSFDGTASFEDLEADDMVEISGLMDADGSIRATRVHGNDAFDPGSSLAELHGVVRGWQPDATEAGSFAIDGITIRYEAGTHFDGLTRDELADAPEVEVEGVLESADEISAHRIQLEGAGLAAEEGEEIELMGFVSDFVSIGDFRVSGFPVDARQAEIDDDLELGDGALVVIEGTLQAGVLVAEEVEEGDDPDGKEMVRIEGTATRIDYEARTLELQGWRIRTDGKTKLKDRFLRIPQFSFDHIAEGDWLEIEAEPVDGEPSALLASRITRLEQGAAASDGDSDDGSDD